MYFVRKMEFLFKLCILNNFFNLNNTFNFVFEIVFILFLNGSESGKMDRLFCSRNETTQIVYVGQKLDRFYRNLRVEFHVSTDNDGFQRKANQGFVSVRKCCQNLDLENGNNQWSCNPVISNHLKVVTSNLNCNPHFHIFGCK
jgi:hypothetical protein